MTLSRIFNMADVLATYYGRNIGHDGINAIKEVGKVVTGSDIDPFDARSAYNVKRAIEKQFPQIKNTSDINLAILDDDSAPLSNDRAESIIQKWVDEQIKKVGKDKVAFNVVIHNTPQ